MSSPIWFVLANMPTTWVVACEFCFFWFMLRDDGITFNPFTAFRRIWPFAKVLFITAIGAVIGFYAGLLISLATGYILMFFGVLPGAIFADRLLRRMRPKTLPWRIFCAATTLAFSAMTFAALTSVQSA